MRAVRALSFVVVVSMVFWRRADPCADTGVLEVLDVPNPHPPTKEKLLKKLKNKNINLN